MSIVFGTWTTRSRPSAFSSSFIAENAVSSPPIVISIDTFDRSNESDGGLEQLRILRGVGAGDADVRAAPEMDAADLFDLERKDPFDVALHDPLEAVPDADDFDAFQAAADGCGADHAVDAGSRAPADENCEPFSHATMVAQPEGGGHG